jgi:hypothetical protein
LKKETKMLQTVESEIDVDGTVRLLEPLSIDKPSRALVTILKEMNESPRPKGNAASVLRFLQGNRLPSSARPNVEAIEAQITEAREAWD